MKRPAAFFILAIILTAGSCSPSSIWNIPSDRLRKQIQKSDYSFLKEATIKSSNLGEVTRLGPGAAYYFYYIFLKAGFRAYALQMLLISCEKEKKIFREESWLPLLRHLLNDKNYPACEKYAKTFIKKYGESKRGKEGKRILIEALYRQKKDEEVVKSLETYFHEEEPSFQDDPELLLFKAVSSSRLNTDGWKDDIIRLFLEIGDAEIIKRAYDYIIGEKVLYNAFDEDMKRYMAAKNSLCLDDSDEIKALALPVIEAYVKSIERPDLRTRAMIKTLGLTYLSLDEAGRGAKLLSSLSADLSGKSALDAFEMAGRCYRKNEQYSLAVKYLGKVIDRSKNDDHRSKNDDQKERAVWFLLDCIQELSPDSFIEAAGRYAPHWRDPSYFDDVLEKEIAELVSLKKWKTIFALHDVLKDHISDEIDSQLSLLRARILSLGYLTVEGVDRTKEINRLLKKAASVGGMEYSGFLASALTGETPRFFRSLHGKNKQIRPESFSGIEAVISGFFEYGLPLEGYEMISENKEELGKNLLLHASRMLSEQGCDREALLVAAYYAYKKNYILTGEEMRYLYPRAFATFIDAHAEKREIRTHLLYALVREESAFDPAIVSSAGAVGLSQLMPETASDLAGWMRLEEYDLYDPETNISLGSYYFARLYRLIESLPKTLIAYNAGMGRLRSWEKTYRGFTDDFFIELIPYKETRGYVKKIIVSAVIYACLYGKESPKQILSEILPGLF